MKIRIALLMGMLALASALGAAALPGTKDPATPTSLTAAEAGRMRMEGERRFQANCGRCHAAPQKFPPRMMSTIVRHMRVRATITDEDMKLVLFYMTQ
jgi:cytochrome c5